MSIKSFTSLRFRNFRLVWLGSITEHIGEFMEVAAILWLVNEITGSPLMLTIVSTCRFMTMIIFPLVGGVVADRMNRRNLLIYTLLLLALLAAILTILAFAKLVAVSHLIIVSLLSGLIMSFNHPARQAIVPNLVKREHLLNAISLDTLSVQISRAIGAAIAGYLIASFEVWPIFALRALGCLLAIFLLTFSKIPATPPITKTQRSWYNLTEGFYYLANNTLILSLLSLYLIPWLALNTLTSFIPVFAKNIVRVGDIGYGYFQAAPGLGAATCIITIAALAHFGNELKLLVSASAVIGIGLIGFSASHWEFLSLALLVAIGGGVTAVVALNTALIQNAIPDKLRGRVMGWREVAFGLGPSGSILFGAIAAYTGVSISLGLLGGICLVISLLLTILMPKFQNIT